MTWGNVDTGNRASASIGQYVREDVHEGYPFLKTACRTHGRRFPAFVATCHSWCTTNVDPNDIFV